MKVPSDVFEEFDAPDGVVGFGGPVGTTGKVVFDHLGVGVGQDGPFAGVVGSLNTEGFDAVQDKPAGGETSSTTHIDHGTDPHGLDHPFPSGGGDSLNVHVGESTQMSLVAFPSVHACPTRNLSVYTAAGHGLGIGRHHLVGFPGLVQTNRRQCLGLALGNGQHVIAHGVFCLLFVNGRLLGCCCCC